MPEIIYIKDFSDERLDVFARMSEAQILNRDCPEKGMFIAESPLVIERALDAGYEPVSILIEDKHIETAGRHILNRCTGIPVFTAPFDVLTQLTGYKLTRGMLCAFKRRANPSPAQILQSGAKVAVLENIMNPTNVGAIFRSAAALGMDAVILTSGCSDPLYRRSIRVSMGNVFNIQWSFAQDSAEILSLLKEFGFASAALALSDSSVSLLSQKLRNEKKLAVFLGTEGEGLSRCVIDGCDYIVKIPMFHDVDSLNVSAAAAVAFWELGKCK